MWDGESTVVADTQASQNTVGQTGDACLASRWYNRRPILGVMLINANPIFKLGVLVVDAMS